MSKIIFDLQLSSFNSLGKLEYPSDSNYVFLEGLVDSIKEQHEIVVLAPKDIKNMPGANICSIGYETDYYSARFKFDWDNVLRAIKNFNPNLIWTNNPIWTMAYKAILRKLKIDIPVICYNHWIDLPNARKENGKYSLEYAQIAGMLASDAILVNSEWGRQLIKKGIFQSINKKVENKIIAFPPPLRVVKESSNEIDLCCVYNHRISSHPYYKDALERLKELMDGQEIQIIFTNPSHKQEIKELNFPNKFVNLQWEEYLILLSHAYCSISTLIDPGAQWSMSIVESVASGVPTLVPNWYGYSEMLPSDYPLYYRDIEEAKSKLNNLLVKRLDVTKYQNYVKNEYGKEKTAIRFNALLEELL